MIPYVYVILACAASSIVTLLLTTDESQRQRKSVLMHKTKAKWLQGEIDQLREEIVELNHIAEHRARQIEALTVSKVA